MATYRDRPSKAQRVTTIALVAALHLGVAALVLRSTHPAFQGGEAPATQLIDVILPPPPPPPPPPEPPRPRPKAAARSGDPGKRANPSPIVAPPPKIVVPAASPVPAAPIAGTGSASSSGSSTSGTGTGGGGTGNGSGGGGQGAGGGIGEDARLLSGGLDRRDYRRLRASSVPAGRAVLAILIAPDGHVSQCSIRQSSGDPDLDATLCAILQPRMRWAPARDRSGRPLTVGIYYTATWERY